MAEGVEGLLRDKTRPPGRAPVAPERVAEVVRLTKTVDCSRSFYSRRGRSTSVNTKPLNEWLVWVCSALGGSLLAAYDGRALGKPASVTNPIAERIGLTNRIGAILTTLWAESFDPLRRDRRMRLEEIRTALGHPVPENAKARIMRLIGRLELVLDQIRALGSQRDTLVAAASEGAPEVMTKRLAELRGVGVQTATVLVREGFVRPFRSAKALGSYPAPSQVVHLPVTRPSCPGTP